MQESRDRQSKRLHASGVRHVNEIVEVHSRSNFYSPTSNPRKSYCFETTVKGPLPRSLRTVSGLPTSCENLSACGVCY